MQFLVEPFSKFTSGNSKNMESSKNMEYISFLYSALILHFNQNVYGCNAGLGEMMPAQLWETTMDPEQRLLKQLVVEDVAEANIVFSSLMGARVCRSLI